MSGVPRAGRDQALVLGEHAVIPGLAATVLVRAIGDWRRAVPPGMSPDGVQQVEQAVAALRAAATMFVAAAAAERLPAPGNGEGQGKAAVADSEEWISTADAAVLAGLTTRRLRQLASERTLECVKVGGRLLFPRTQVCSLAARRGT